LEDRRLQIPTACWVNLAIIDRLQGTETFRKYCIEVPQEAGFLSPTPDEPWPFMNLSWGAYMLYCLLVVPKELYQLAKDDPFYKSLKARHAMADFSFKKQKCGFDEDPLYHLKSLRNAVSHVNFRIDTSNTLVFWDHPPRRPTERHWEVWVAHDDLIQFLHVVADESHKLYSQIRTGQRQWTTST
jgi:hypothetical protein